MVPTLKKFMSQCTSIFLIQTHFLSDGLSLPGVNNSVNCSNMHWPCYFTLTLRSSDPVGDARNAPNHKLIIQPKAVVAVGAHSKLEAKKGYIPQYQVPINVGLLFHF